MTDHHLFCISERMNKVAHVVSTDKMESFAIVLQDQRDLMAEVLRLQSKLQAHGIALDDPFAA